VRPSVLGVGLAVLGVATLALAHEERLVSGRVETFDAHARVLVVEDRVQDRTVRVTVDRDTEVRRCRTASGLGGLAPGTHVSIKYLDRGDGGFDTLSVLVLPEPQGR
jgi:hypothetical protein